MKLRNEVLNANTKPLMTEEINENKNIPIMGIGKQLKIRRTRIKNSIETVRVVRKLHWSISLRIKLK